MTKQEIQNKIQELQASLVALQGELDKAQDTPTKYSELTQAQKNTLLEDLAFHVQENWGDGDLYDLFYTYYPPTIEAIYGDFEIMLSQKCKSYIEAYNLAKQSHFNTSKDWHSWETGKSVDSIFDLVNDNDTAEAIHKMLEAKDEFNRVPYEDLCKAITASLKKMGL